MRRSVILSVIICAIQGCTPTVEIPIGQVGVVANDGEVDAEVLLSGEHPVRRGSEIIVYDVRSEKVEMRMVFLFSDTTAGNLGVAIEFMPIADSLSSFYRKYRSTHVAPVVQQSMRQVADDLLFTHKANDLRKDEFEVEILRAMKANQEINRYVQIYELEIIEFKF